MRVEAQVRAAHRLGQRSVRLTGTRLTGEMLSLHLDTEEE